MYNFENTTKAKDGMSEVHAVFSAIKTAYDVKHCEPLNGGWQFGHNPICEHHITFEERDGAVLILDADFCRVLNIVKVSKDMWQLKDKTVDLKQRCKELTALFSEKLAAHWGVPESVFAVSVDAHYSNQLMIDDYMVSFNLDDLANNKPKQQAIKRALETITRMLPHPATRHYNF